MTTTEERPPTLGTEIISPTLVRSSLHIMDKTGDSAFSWSKDSADEIAIAKAAFDAGKAKGHLAYRVTGEAGTKGEVMKEFDSTAERIIMSPQLVGG